MGCFVGFLKDLLRYRQILVVLLSPIILLPLPLLVPSAQGKCGYALILLGIYWGTEILPMAVTALVPVVLFPILGIMTLSNVCSQYIKGTSMLLLGGIIVALAIEKWNLHKIVALGILSWVEARPRWLILGFMICTWFLSMWISNTAATAMMLPVVDAVLERLKPHPEQTPEETAVGYDGPAADVQETVLDMRDTTDNMPNGVVKTGDHRVSTKPVESYMEMPMESSSTSLQTAEEQKKPDTCESDDSAFNRLPKGMVLCICYAANVGGTGTIVGTPPNLVMKNFVDELYRRHNLESPVNFGSFMAFTVPAATIILIISWLYMSVYSVGFRRTFGHKNDVSPENEARVKALIQKERKDLGKLSFAQISVNVILLILVLLWFFRVPQFMPGWADLFAKNYTGDALPAILIVVVLVIFPSKRPRFFCCGGTTVEESDCDTSPTLMDWETIQRGVPWGVILVVGGGFALAQACVDTGLSAWIGEQLSVFKHLPDWVMLLSFLLIVVILTEVTSNTATTTILMPIMASLADKLKKHPLYLLFPVTISTSMAFMLPVATTPNAIVFATKRVRVIDMILAGFLLKIICVFVLVMATHAWGWPLFNMGTLPWETNMTTSLAGSVSSYSSLLSSV